MCDLVEKYTGINSKDVIVASTGVIGQPLDIVPIAEGMDALVKSLGDNSKDAAEGIMTTDTIMKEIAVEFKKQHNMDLDKKKIILTDSIKAFGNYEVAIKLHPQVTGKFVVKVTEA